MDNLMEIVARYSDAQLAEARNSIARWDETDEMPASLARLARIIHAEIAFRRAEDSALEEGAR
jgi:hypothetical protein